MNDLTLLEVAVAGRRELADGIVGYELEADDGGPLPEFEAGAHIDVHVPGGLVRQYSLYALPGKKRTYRIAVLRDPQSRGGSARMFDTVREGDRIAISPPRNHFALHPEATQSLLFAGGIGITPILCMAQRLSVDGREFALHYCGRSSRRMAFVELLCTAAYSGHVQVHVDDGAPPQQFAALSAIGPPAQGKHLYVCGPTGFMDHVLGTARSLGWPEERLHREYFAGAVIDHSADGPFEIELRSTGRVIRVAADQSAAQAMLDAGLDVPLSCEQGVCGTCITKVAAGVPDHRDLFLTDGEHARNDSFTPCCSRSRTPRLVLDL